jgi:hypothetical protein
MQVNGAGDPRRPVRTGIAHIHEQAFLLIELFLGFVDLNLRNLIHGSRSFRLPVNTGDNMPTAFHRRKPDHSSDSFKKFKPFQSRSPRPESQT